jgi:alpha-ribazole phosphatase
MTKFYLVRHGQTDWNIEGRYQGQADTLLNKAGEEQAALAATQFIDKPVDAIFSSDLQRARHTAESIGKQVGLPVHLDPRLREINHGIWEGMLYSDIVREYADEMKERDVNPMQARAPEGESVAEVSKRVLAAADDIARAYPEGTVVLVSHGLSLAVLTCAGHGFPLTEVFKHIPNNAQPDLIEWTPDPSRMIG